MKLALGKDRDEKCFYLQLCFPQEDLLYSKQTSQFWSILEVFSPSFKYSSLACANMLTVIENHIENENQL